MNFLRVGVGWGGLGAKLRFTEMFSTPSPLLPSSTLRKKGKELLKGLLAMGAPLLGRWDSFIYGLAEHHLVPAETVEGIALFSA